MSRVAHKETIQHWTLTLVPRALALLAKQLRFEFVLKFANSPGLSLVRNKRYLGTLKASYGLTK